MGVGEESVISKVFAQSPRIVLQQWRRTPPVLLVIAPYLLLQARLLRHSLAHFNREEFFFFLLPLPIAQNTVGIRRAIPRLFPDLAKLTWRRCNMNYPGLFLNGSEFSRLSNHTELNIDETTYLLCR